MYVQSCVFRRHVQATGYMSAASLSWSGSRRQDFGGMCPSRRPVKSRAGCSEANEDRYVCKQTTMLLQP